jgi:hypothetical protein
MSNQREIYSSWSHATSRNFERLQVQKATGVILKIDFEKAYDNVNWDFLLDCCRQKGFRRDSEC